MTGRAQTKRKENYFVLHSEVRIVELLEGVGLGEKEAPRGSKGRGNSEDGTRWGFWGAFSSVLL